MIQFRNERVQESPVVVAGGTFTAVSTHSALAVTTPWFSLEVAYRRPAWVEVEDTGQRIKVVDVVALWRLAMAVVVFLATTRRSTNV